MKQVCVQELGTVVVVVVMVTHVGTLDCTFPDDVQDVYGDPGDPKFRFYSLPAGGLSRSTGAIGSLQGHLCVSVSLCVWRTGSTKSSSLEGST